MTKRKRSDKIIFTNNNKRIMSKYVISGSQVKIFSDGALNVHDKLPVGTYRVATSPQGEIYLDSIANFTLSNRIYGSHEKMKNRIINTFLSREGSTGILLSGLKGTGKTLLTKDISISLREQGISSVVVDAPIPTTALSAFLQQIADPVVIIFDEFEKLYSEKDDQEGLLGLLDGIYGAKRMFIIGVNEKEKINNYFIHRPGRIFYNIEYKALGKDIVEEYANDNLINKSHTRDILMISTIIHDFSFDVLKALVEECNRYDESPFESIKYLNISLVSNLRYDVEVTDLISGKVVVPFDKKQSVNYNIHKKDGYDENDNYFSHNKSVRIDLRWSREGFDIDGIRAIADRLKPLGGSYITSDEDNNTYNIKKGDVIMAHLPYDYISPTINSNGDFVFIDESLKVQFKLRKSTITSDYDAFRDACGGVY